MRVLQEEEKEEKKKVATVIYVVGPSNRSTTLRIKEHYANEVTLVNVPTTRPIYQFRGETVPISYPKSEDNPSVQEDPKIETLLLEKL